MLAAGLFSMGVIFIQEYINKSKLMKEKEEGKRFFYMNRDFERSKRGISSTGIFEFICVCLIMIF